MPPQSLKQQVAELVEPVYNPDTGALPKATGALQGFFAKVDSLRATLAGGGDAAAAIDELSGIAPDTASDQTLGYLLTADAAAYDLLQRQARGALETVFADSITVRHHRRRARESEVDRRRARRVVGDGDSGLRSGRGLHPAQPSARRGADPRSAGGGHGPR